MNEDPAPNPLESPRALATLPDAPKLAGVAIPYSSADWDVSDETSRRIADSVPPNTRAAYSNVSSIFNKWCAEHNRVPLPATGATLAEYVSHLRSGPDPKAPATISQHIGAIRKMHRVAGYPGQPDTERAQQILRGYRRERAADGIGEEQAPPLLPDALRRCIESLNLATLAGRRDQLLLVLGFTMMARRSELASVLLCDTAESADGLEVLLRTSKVDKDSRGVIIAIPPSSHPDVDPVRLTREWKATLADEFHIIDGPLLRRVTRSGKPLGGLTPQSVNDIVQRVVADARIPDAHRYSAHSLRAGGLTAALRAGIPLAVAARHGRWSPTSPVVIAYARAADRWRDNAMRGVL